MSLGVLLQEHMNKLLTSMVAFILFHDKERAIGMVASSLWPNYEWVCLPMVTPESDLMAVSDLSLLLRRNIIQDLLSSFLWRFYSDWLQTSCLVCPAFQIMCVVVCLVSWCTNLSNIWWICDFYILLSCHPVNEIVLLSTFNKYAGGLSFYLWVGWNLSGFF